MRQSPGRTFQDHAEALTDGYIRIRAAFSLPVVCVTDNRRSFYPRK